MYKNTAVVMSGGSFYWPEKEMEKYGKKVVEGKRM
jgi:hypothetical protein